MNALNAAQRMQMIEKFETLTMSEYGALVSENEQLRQRIAELEKERDELLEAAEAIEIDAEECLDFDECTAMLVPIDTYHKLMEAIASVKGSAA